MAGGGIVSVEPVDSGGYRAQLADGSSMRLDDSEAARALYERKRSDAIGPDALAMNDTPPTPGQASDVPQNPAIHQLPGGGASMSLADARRLHDLPPSQSQPAAQPAAPTQQASAQAASAPQGAQPAAQQQRDGPLGFTMKGIDPATGKEIQGPAVMKDGVTQIYIGPKAGSPGGLTKLGKSELEHDAATEQQVQEARAREEQATEVGTQAAKAEANSQAAYLQQRKQEMQTQVQQQQDEQAKIQGHVDDLQSKYDKAHDDFMNSKVDPDQYMKGGHGAVGIFSALGVALAQYGSAFTGQPNIAAQFVNNQIDRSIRAQEAQIQVKGRGADNMLSNLTRETGNLNLAKTAMRQLLTERAAVEAQAVGARYKGTQIQASSDAVAAKLQGDVALQDNARRRGNLEHVMTNKMYYQQGSSAVPGHFATPTQESMSKNNADEIANRREQLAENKAAATGAGGALPRSLQLPAYAVDSVRNLGPKILGAYGVKRGQDVGAVEGAGLGVTRGTAGKSARDIDSMLPIFFEEHTKMVTGQAPGEAKMAEFRENMKHMSTAQKLNFVNNGLDQADEKSKYIDSQRGKGEPLGDVPSSPEEGGL